MDKKKRISDQFQGLPMDKLIGGPLTAICDSQAMLARATQDYIESVGFDDDANIRMIDFKFDRPLEVEQENGRVEKVMQSYTVKVPFISIVSVPNLQVDQAKIDFCMEVKASFEEEHKENSTDEQQASAKNRKAQQNRSRTVLTGSVTKQNSQNAATFNVSLSAKQNGVPEGLARLMDILHKSIAPIEDGEPRLIEPKDKK